MEKLKPILKHRYWICFGLALIFVLAGWWNASGDLAAKTTVRKASVDGSFTLADKGKTEPNELWVAGGKKKNEDDSVAYKEASLQLWKRQQTAREWPEQIRDEMKRIEYFAEVNNKETRERWVETYPDQFEDLLEIVQPFQHDTGEGLVLVNPSKITPRQPDNKWQINLPSSNEIWSNQEDIWFLKALLTSISKANDSATRITESQVREIKRLTLRGGDRNTKPGAITSQGAGAVGNMSGLGGRRDPDDDRDSGSSFSVAPGPGTQTHPGKAFEGNGGQDILAEEYGGVAGANMFRSSGTRDVDSDDDSGGLAAAKAEVRYVDGADKDIGYKTRAFLLDVLIRDDRLPDLLAKLTNSDFPVEIVRVEIVPSAKGAAGASGVSRGMTNVDDDESGGLMRAMSGGASGGFLPGSGYGGVPGLGGSSRRRGKDADDDSSGYSGEADQMGAGLKSAAAADALNVAMADPLLIEVHIGGLMTLYMTPEEAKMQAKTEETDAKDAATATPADASTDATSASDAPEKPEAADPGSETPETNSSPETSAPDTSKVGQPVESSAPGPPVSSEETGDGSAATAPEGEIPAAPASDASSKTSSPGEVSP